MGQDNISEHKMIIARLENEVKKKHENSTDENNAEMKTVWKLERIMRENLDQVEKNLKESLFLQVKENNINEKLNEVLEQNKTFADAVKTVHTGNSAKPSLPNTTETQGVNFRQIIQGSKNEELVQQKEREARSQNFIIQDSPNHLKHRKGTTKTVTTSENCLV